MTRPHRLWPPQSNLTHAGAAIEHQHQDGERYLSLNSLVAELQSNPQTNAETAASPFVKWPGTKTPEVCVLSLQSGRKKPSPVAPLT